MFILDMIKRILVFTPLIIWILAGKKWKEVPTGTKPFRSFLIGSIIFSIIVLFLSFYIAVQMYPSGDYADARVIIMPFTVVWGILSVLGIVSYLQALSHLKREDS